MADGVTQQPVGSDDADRWKEAAQVRHAHPGWVVIWLASTRQYRAYRLSETRRCDPLTATTAAGLAEQISVAPSGRR